MAALIGLGTTGPAAARRRAPKGPPPGTAIAAAQVQAPLRAALEDTLRAASGRADLTLDRLWWVAPTHGAHPGVALATALSPDKPGGVLGLFTAPAGQAPTLEEHVYLPRLRDHVWGVKPPLDLDGDRRDDLVVPWRETSRGLQRDGVILVRTAPVGMHRVELGTAFRGKGTRVPVACFVPLLGERAHMLALHQIADGQHGFELLEPAPAGGWRPFSVYTAALAQEVSEGEATRRYWQGLGPRGAAGRRSPPQQADLGPCPGEGLLVPSRLVGGAGSPGWAVLGPFARSSAAVRARLKHRKSARAALIIQLGNAPIP